MRLSAFVVALLLLAGAFDPSRGWMITLVVVTGLAAFRPSRGRVLDWGRLVDARVIAFILAVLLLAGVFEPSRGWLIVLVVVTGMEAFTPRLFAGYLLGDGHTSWRRGEWRWGENRHHYQRQRRLFGDDWP